MIHHFEGIMFQDRRASIHLPNSIFKTLSHNIRNRSGKINSPQVTFAYTYLVAVAFLYRYTYYIDIDNETYIQNGDIKELLGYSRTTKSIDRIIKKGGVLDSLCLTDTTKEYPVSFMMDENERINNIPVIDFITMNELESISLINYEKIDNIVKNKNYEVKTPLFLTSNFDDNEYGTMYSFEQTHEITIDEFLTFVKDGDLSNTSFMIYGYLKSVSKGYENNKRERAVYKIIDDINVDVGVFYKHLTLLKEKRYIEVEHKEWSGKKGVKMEANTYKWLGIS